MASLRYFLLLLAVFELAIISFATAIQPRISNGAPVDTLRRFPHHISIEPIYGWYNDGPKLCGGSLIQQNWILTSSACVRYSSRLILQIERLYRNDTSGSYSIIVNNNPKNVILYPTGVDDIALIKLPVQLIFSNQLKPISIWRSSSEQLQNKLAVLPGFDSGSVYITSTSPPYTTSLTTSSSTRPSTPGGTSWYPQRDDLTYAMLSIVSNSVCQNVYKDFDEYLQICTKGWGNNRNVACLTDYGSGLVANWPADPRLVGVYAASSYDCSSSSPSVYTNVEKYSDWIDSVIWNN